MKPRIPTYIHTETGPATGHMLHAEDPRHKGHAKSGGIGEKGAAATVENPAGADPLVSPRPTDVSPEQDLV